ncbi:MAG: tetratricopeptide repeat protein [Candidatus Latescibacterota bacterium]|nr:MAG: tetratricopeptide repeat protein [Candidatus Latescibacterota bacterium]
MRKTTLVYMGLVCALLGAGLPGTTPVASANPIADTPDDHNYLPTVGGKPAFATKADGMVSTIETHMQSENYAAAAKAAAELTEHYPQFLKGWTLLGYCLQVTADYSGSNKAYNKALELGGEPKNLNSRMAYNHVRLGQFDEAKNCYKAILAMESENAEALRQLGYIEAKLGNLDEASHYYHRALEQEATNTELILALAKVESKRGGNGSVKALIEEGLKLDPDNPAFLGKLGLIHIKHKDYQSALVPLTKLVSIEPDNVKAHRNLGVAYYQLGEKKKAKNSFERVRELGGEFDDLYGPMADCYLAAGESHNALVVIKEGIDKGVQQAWLYSLWGKMLERSKNYDEAIGKFAKAVDTGEEPWSAYARKQIARQSKLKKREQMMASQAGSP